MSIFRRMSYLQGKKHKNLPVGLEPVNLSPLFFFVFDELENLSRGAELKAKH